MLRPYLHGYIVNNEGTLVDVSEQGGGDTSIISTPRGIDRFFTALFSGRLLPPARLRPLLSLLLWPVSPGADRFGPQIRAGWRPTLGA